VRERRGRPRRRLEQLLVHLAHQLLHLLHLLRRQRPAGRTLEITVTGRTVDPAPSTVRLGVGETLTLTVTSDHDDELHIHGFDVEKELSAGVAQSVTVTGKDPGVYEVETHHPELRLLKIAVR
jgi:hypothetical protein